MAIPAGKRWTPEDAADATALPRRYAAARGEWRFVHLPERWNWNEDSGEWLPALAEMSFTPGVNGIRSQRGRPLNVSAAKGLIGDKGGNVIDPKDRRLGKYQGYLQSFKNDGGGVRWVSIFENPETVGRRAYWTRDADGYTDFCRVLMAQGLVDSMSQHVLRTYLEKLDFKIQNYVKKVGSNPTHEGISATLERLRATRYGMENGVGLDDSIAILRGISRETVDVEPVPAEPVKRGPGRPPKKRPLA
tara:strand:- start:4484 stop:5224 length:741 start_codon:yes stop_codon:yes gene_type:complete